MNSIDNLSIIPRKSQSMTQIVRTYFVETHEYNFENNNCDLLEYFAYTFGDKGFSRGDISDVVHHTVLTLVVM